MKKLLVIVMSLMMVVSMMPTAFADVAYAESSIPEIDYGTPGEDYEPGQVIVCVKGGTQALMASGIFSSETTKLASGSKQISPERFDGETGKIAGEKIEVEETLIEEEKEDIGLVLINSNKADITSLIEKLEQLECVQFAEPNVKCEPTYIADDAMNEPAFDYQWYLNKTATKVDYDINAKEAYQNPKFSAEKEVVVAVMDSGVDYEHPDLKDSMWTATPQLKGIIGGGDYGINTVDGESSTDPMDTEIGHGTHCASTIASTWNNNEGIAGINGNVKIMACKWMSAQGGYISDYVTAMKYVIEAKNKGVNIVATNNSWGPGISTAYCGGVTEVVANLAGEEGIVSCFAAGNSGYDHDKYTNFAYSSPYIVEVGAMQSNGEAAYFTERGAHTVDVFAPGTQILAATSRYDNPDFYLEMDPQYLPWIQASSDSIVYQDFGTSTDSAIYAEAHKVVGSTVEAPDLIANDTNGYNDSYAKKVDLSGFAVGNQLSFEINIPLSELGTPETNERYYMAFQAGVKNAEIYANNSGNEIERYGLIDYYKGTNTWASIKDYYGDPMKWRLIDNNWAVFSEPFDEETMSDLISAAENNSDVLKVRLRFNIRSKTQNATFRFDNFGIGNKNSDYYYSNGTSMATPCAAGVVSLIAGAMDSITNSSDAKEVIAKLKGGVLKTDKLNDECITQGFVQADSAFKNESQLNPVPDTVSVSGNTATISGYFFGDNQGTVTIGGKKATVASWSKTSIKVTVPNDIKYKSYEYVITREDGKKGRNFGVFRENQQGEEAAYEEIPVADFEYGGGDEVIKTEKLLPVRIAVNDDGILALLSDEDETGNVLQFYSFENESWTKVDWPMNTEEVGNSEPFTSLVGQGHKFYLLAPYYTDWSYVYDGYGNPIGYKDFYGNERIVTYTTSTLGGINQTKSTLVSDGNNIGSILGIGYDGELYITLGSKSKDTSIKKLNPDTGKTSITSLGSLPNTYIQNNTKPCAGSYLISGSMHMMTGIQPIVNRMNDSTPGATSLRAALRSDSGTWKMVNSSILDVTDGGRTYEQNQIAAYGATDQGYIMAGPAKKIGEEDMVDTWAYIASSDSFQEISARVDPERLRAQAGTCYNGKFYVMGSSHSRGNKLFLKFLDLESVGLSWSLPAEITSGGGGGGTGGGSGSGGGGGGDQEEPETKTTDAEPVVTYDSEDSGLNVAIEGLTEGVDYKVILPEDSDKVGTHTVEIVFIGAYSKMEKKTVTYVVLPKGTEISKISAKKKSMVVKFKKQTSQTSGYQIRYSTSSSMKSAKTITIKRNTATKKTIKKLKSKKKYYVQTRTYAKLKEGETYKNYYSHWGKVKSVKVK